MRAPKIIGENWINSKPLQSEDLTNKVILYDFWTYSCVNCQRTIPYLKKWWEKYSSKNFLIIGIHTPEFKFEKDPENVEQAIKELGVGWPVVLDNDYINWNNFANHYWPAKYLTDKSGGIIYTHFGEGAYEETEKKIQELIGESSGADLAAAEIDEHEHGQVCFIPTPETYCGYGRGRIANDGGYKEDQVTNYVPPKNLESDSIALSGKFLATPEYVQSEEAEAKLLLNFRATEVNLVLRPAGDQAVVEVSLNNKPLKTLTVKDPTMYNLLKTESLTEGTISIGAKEGKFQAYAFTFSGCEA